MSEQKNQRSFLRHAYTAQPNPPQESYMKFVPSEKFHPRRLRKVGCTSAKNETLKIVEAPEKKKKRRFLTPKRKTILMGSVIGTLVGCIGLAIALTLLIQSLFTKGMTTTTTTTQSTTVTTATTTTSTSATTTTSTSTSTTSRTSSTSTSTTTSKTTSSTSTTTTTTGTTTTTSTSTTTTATTTTTTTVTTTTSTTTTTTTATTTTVTTSTSTTASTATTTTVTTTTTTTATTTTKTTTSTTTKTTETKITTTTTTITVTASTSSTTSPEVTTFELEFTSSDITTEISDVMSTDFTSFSMDLETFDSTDQIWEESTTSEYSSSYWVSGVITDLDSSILVASNWTECYRSTYADIMNTTEVDIALTQCNKNKLLMACKLVTDSNYTLAAMGLRNDVLFDCLTNSTCVHVSNGVGWYFSENYSWGFVDGTDSVNRDVCDNTTSINPSLRLCWNTDGSTGGFRCGSTTDLDSNSTWIRSIWHTD